jgi:ABC-type dipeptide/oligopeptide/nickel transport system permease component
MYNVYTYKSNWWRFVGKRVLIAVVAFFVITFLIFSLNRLFVSPSDTYLPPLTNEQLERLRHIETYDRPGYKLYYLWIKGFFTGYFGYAYNDYPWLTDSK